ncbi:undecaprenyldiphospho-muramoylpentapeptide beta-N-acetylglucosaminyltransferase [Paenibacillus chungangensis]|uniref:UDP-N-acetylglucosamine--N-acetylmuramyl-(pentapeptide) pyrophosphoryl-undecaprenol N-acetylglucosamine transferase n=1 Tax=Paenibacillus chungangensis TaxID=696535 RepID=A0ABW3HUD5_9BACL
MRTIMFTGGGSAGHVTVNLALIPEFLKDGWQVEYIGSTNGIERTLLESKPEVRYWPIETGKLRRYLDLQNVKDPFKVLKGMTQAYRIIRKQKPAVLFSKGGFVSVPVVFAAWLNRVPVIIHESDMTPGLANRIAIPFATGVCTTFPETARSQAGGKYRHIGPIIREEMRQGRKERGRALCDFHSGKPVLMMMGGSLGARRLNEVLRESLDELLERFQIVHLCGKNGVDGTYRQRGYKQFEYVNEELPHLLAMSDIVVSRAGSNSIFEFLALEKPMLLVPLPKGQSRGDQLQNAESFRRLGYCDVLQEENLTAERFMERVLHLYANRQSYREAMREGNENQGDGLAAVRQWLLSAARK